MTCGRAKSHTGVVSIVLFLLLHASCRNSDRGFQQTIRNTSEILDSITNNEQTSIPDAILNETRAIVVLPANSAVGAVSWRTGPNAWTNPSVAIYRGTRNSRSDVLLLILRAGDAQQLRRGNLALAPTTAGPLSQSKPVLTASDLRWPAVAYERQGNKLSGAIIQGEVIPGNNSAARVDSTSTDLQHARNSLISFFNVITPAGIIIHHTAALPTSERVPVNKQQVDAYHSQKGMDVICFNKEFHVAYHFLILQDGTVQPGRPERCQGAHAFAYNSFIGISVVGDFSSKDNPDGAKGLAKPTPRQLEALVQLSRRLMTRYGFPVQRVMRHSDVSSTECPGDRFPFNDVLRGIQH